MIESFCHQHSSAVIACLFILAIVGTYVITYWILWWLEENIKDGERHD